MFRFRTNKTNCHYYCGCSRWRLGSEMARKYLFDVEFALVGESSVLILHRFATAPRIDSVTSRGHPLVHAHAGVSRVRA